MSEPAKSFLQRWMVTTIGVLVAAGIVTGITADHAFSLLVASLLLGIFNAFLRPVLLLLALPLLILTLGLFTLVINSLLLYWVGFLVKGFYVADFWAAFKGSILISIISFIANGFLGNKEVRVERNVRVQRGRPRPRDPNGPPPGSGPIIDV